MPTGTPGHFSGGAKGGGKYDTATQTVRGGGGSKGGFAGKQSTVRPLTPQEHNAAADHLASGGHHHAAAHHRSAAEQMDHESTTEGAGDASMENGMYGKGPSKPNASAPPGQGGRFAALKGKLSKEPDVDDPGAVAAAAGRKKFGAKKFGQMSHGE